ncbi:MAG: HAMP domain-containing histidine kinase [Lachnospiraceae bacterium]|nr:HAMP domain-containing histidine kinase [Lachnospiraceae bacterium]
MDDYQNQRSKAILLRWIAIASVIVFWLTTVLLAFYYFLHKESEAAERIVVWLVLSQTIVMLLTIFSNSAGRKFRRMLSRRRAREERERINDLEIIATLCAGNNAVFYADLLSGEVKVYNLNEVMSDRIGSGFEAGHDFEWYVEYYCNRLVCEESRSEFRKQVNKENLREKLKDREYYTYTYVGDLFGEKNYFQMKAAKVNGSENHIVIGFTDVDEEVRENMERQDLVQRALSQTLEANKIKDSILTNIATEIMDPINSIVEIARLLSANDTNSQSVRSSGKHILMETENLGMMLNDIMEMNRLQSEQIVFKKEKADIKQLIENVVMTASERAKARCVSFSLNTSVVHNNVLCDAKRIFAVVQHICNFVTEFTFEENTVNVEFDEIRTSGHKAYYSLKVSNNGGGLGVDPKLLKALSEENNYEEICVDPFYNQILGLYIAKTIVEIKKGEFAISSNESSGTTIEISLNLTIED